MFSGGLRLTRDRPGSWLKSWEAVLGILLLVASPALPAGTHPFTLADAALWFGAIVLGTGLLKDLWALLVTKPAHGDKEVAMCAESIVGAGTVVLGLAVIVLGFVKPAWGVSSVNATWSMLAAGLGATLLFSAWVHDLVIVRRQGKLRLVRDPDHGSFVVHFFRGEAKACMLPPPE